MYVDLLGAATVDATDATHATDKALAGRKKNRLYDDLAARSRQRDRLLASPLTDAQSSAELDELLREMTALENELTLLDTQPRTNPAVHRRC